MKKTALVIGNSTYKGNAFLKNPINDAIDISDLLKKIGFSVILELDATNETMDRMLQKFEKNLNKSDIGLFYFAGHGVQVKGVNFLVAIDSKTNDETALKHSSTSLNQVLDIMDKCKNETNIIILDACRDNPYERSWNRDQYARGFASVFAPKGTIISFSTSPGQYAADGVTNNSPFAYALLNHIPTANISIEELFKRVRETVMASTKNKQISWEHTSLIGNFQFNSGNYISVETGYDENCVADCHFKSDGKGIEKIIEELKSSNWYDQNPAVHKIYTLDPNKENKSLQFLLGRNILQVADGTERQANRLIRDVETFSKFNVDGENHLLNGLLFEIYFDSEGKFRIDKFKSKLIGDVLDTFQTKYFLPSINFIREQLLPYSDDLFVIPNVPIETISFNLVFEKNNEKSIRLTEIQFEGRNILKVDKKNDYKEYYMSEYYDDFCKGLAIQLAIPIKQVTFTNNYGLTDENKIAKPFKFAIKKYVAA